MHEMKMRGRRGVIAAVAVTAVIAAACSSGTTGPSASDTDGGQGVTASTSPSSVASPSPSAVDAATSALNGVYRWTITKQDGLDHGMPENKTPQGQAQFPLTVTVTLRHGNADSKSSEGGTATGTYMVSGDRLILSFPGVTTVMTFTISADTKGDLTLTPVVPIDPGDAFIWSTEPWTKIGDVSSADSASALNGTYRWTISKEVGLAQSPRPDDIDQFPLLITVTLKGSSGTFAVAFAGASSTLLFDDSGTYTVAGNRMTFRGSNPGAVTFTFSADAEGNLTVTAVEGMDAADAYVWSTEVWTKIQ